MARGGGPKLVVDVGVDLKRRFHARLALEGRTVKSWMTERIETYVGGPQQLPLYPPDFSVHEQATAPYSPSGPAGPPREPAGDSGARPLSSADRRPVERNGGAERRQNRSSRTKTSRSKVS